MRNLITVVCIMLIALSPTGCRRRSETADQIQSQQTRVAMGEAQRQVGMPAITNFQQRKLMRMILELCDREDLICYAYIKSDYHGKLCFIGKCIGYGIPFSAQFTNPMRVADASNEVRGRELTGFNPIVLPQPDPNGLFMPTSSSATWLMMIDPESGDPRPVYIEPEIVVSPFPLIQEE